MKSPSCWVQASLAWQLVDVAQAQVDPWQVWPLVQWPFEVQVQRPDVIAPTVTATQDRDPVQRALQPPQLKKSLARSLQAVALG